MAAVQRFEPEAFGWWSGSSTVLDGPALLVIDHLDPLLERVNEPTSVEILGVLRSDRQSAGEPVEQLLIGRTDGRLAAAFDDADNPLYHAGQKLRIRRALPSQFVDDLVIGRPWVDAPTAWVGAAAELANGCPAYVWRMIDEARGRGRESDGPIDAVVRSWQAMQALGEPGCAQRYQELASINPAAPLMVSAIASGVGPYALGLNSKRVHDALTRLRARGAIFAPRPRTWTISDPMLGSWARAHTPPSVRSLSGDIQVAPLPTR
jgi:hypothetical protein